MKYLKNLPNHNAYEAFIKGNQYNEIYLEKNEVVSYCCTEQHVHYNPYIPPVPKVLDILYSDAQGNLSYTSEVLPITDGKTPIALCIAGQNFFGDNEKARWMSLKFMDCETPDTGSLTTHKMYFGNNGLDVPTIDNIEVVCNNMSAFGYLSEINPNANASQKIPALFTENNEWNISALGDVNTYAITDIDGKNKTNKILITATEQPTWQTDTSIINSQNKNFTPAVCCCYRYHTYGTQNGDWYLGGAGEMATMIAQKTSINEKLTSISSIYPTDCISTFAADGYYTTTESSGWGIYNVNVNNGYIGGGGKSNTLNVIALLQY